MYPCLCDKGWETNWQLTYERACVPQTSARTKEEGGGGSHGGVGDGCRSTKYRNKGSDRYVGTDALTGKIKRHRHICKVNLVESLHGMAELGNSEGKKEV